MGVRNLYVSTYFRTLDSRTGAAYDSWNYNFVRNMNSVVLHTRVTSSNVMGWKQRIKQGLDVTTTLYGTRYVARSRGDGVVQIWHPTAGKAGREDMIIHKGDTVALRVTRNLSKGGGGSMLTEAGSIAAINFTKNYRNQTRTWNTGQFAGELAEASRQLARPGRELRRGVEALYGNLKRVVLRNRFTGGRDPTRAVARAIAGTYLEWQFGIKPLVNDMDDAAMAFAELAVGNHFDMIRIKGIGEVHRRIDGLSGLQDYSAYGSDPRAGKCSLEVYDSEQVTIRGAWRNSNPSGEMPVPQRFGIGIDSIVPTAWELVPWSFFVDYFSNIGNVLDAWSMRFIQFAWMNRTVRSCRTYMHADPTYDFSGGPGTYFARSSGGQVTFKRYDVERNPYSAGSFDPGFYVQIPGFESSGKWLNIDALLAMRIKPR